MSRGGLTHEQYTTWLASLQPGDQVASSRQGFFGHRGIYTIERLTATQFVLCGNQVRYRRSNGRVVGGDYHSIAPVTQEIRDANERAALLSWLSEMESRSRRGERIELRTLRAMKDAHDKATRELSP